MKHYKHRSDKLDQYLDRKVRVIFKNDTSCVGILEKIDWKYGMQGCDYYGPDGKKERHCEGKFTFSKSHVRKIKGLL